MGNVTIPIQMAPTSLSEPILPGWQFSLFSVDLGDSSDPGVEKSAIAEIGSYGKQIGHIAEALEIVIDHLKLLDAENLPEPKKDILRIFLGDVAAIRKVKRKHSSAARSA